jgi:hypothetical protein
MKGEPVKSRVWNGLLVASISICVLAPAFADIKKGDKLQALANLHPDLNRHLLYTINYQLPSLIPVCADVTVTEVHGKSLYFLYQEQEFELKYDSFSKDAGVSFQKAAQTYLGPACDKAKMQTLGKLDQEGIRIGRPKVGMTREGVLFAMGRPPFHVNPNLDVPEWHYWKNRFATELVEFDEQGKVIEIQ